MFLRLVVMGLNGACAGIDQVLYRPRCRAVRVIARHWNCRLARVSVNLDARWGTNYWGSQIAPGAPCAICCYRPSYYELGGDDEDPDAEVIPVCGWCDITGDWSDVGAALADARRRLV